MRIVLSRHRQCMPERILSTAGMRCVQTVAACLAIVWIGQGVSSADDAAPGTDTSTVGDASRDAQQEQIDTRSFHAGYRREIFEIETLDGATAARQLDLWYPTEAPEAAYLYLYQWGSIAVDAELADGRHPLLVFSHGFMSASDQSIYIMEACARAGFIVAAMNHHDALLNQRDERVAPPRATDLADWTENHYVDRRHDIVSLLDALAEWNASPDHPWSGQINFDAVGAIGHSLGGYTVLGLAGAWPEWRDPRIKAVVLYSPYVHPFRLNGELESIDIPVMMQGATLDIGISQYLLTNYRRLDCPKHYLILKNATHLVWTNFVSLRSTTTECLEDDNPELVVRYTIAFFDHFLLGQDQSALLENDDDRLHDWAAHLEAH